MLDCNDCSVAQWLEAQRREGSAAPVLSSILVAAFLRHVFNNRVCRDNRIRVLVLLVLGTLHKYAARACLSTALHIHDYTATPTRSISSTRLVTSLAKKRINGVRRILISLKLNHEKTLRFFKMPYITSSIFAPLNEIYFSSPLRHNVCLIEINKNCKYGFSDTRLLHLVT